MATAGLDSNLIVVIAVCRYFRLPCCFFAHPPGQWMYKNQVEQLASQACLPSCTRSSQETSRSRLGAAGRPFMDTLSAKRATMMSSVFIALCLKARFLCILCLRGDCT